jgi:hypothetical protein
MIDKKIRHSWVKIRIHVYVCKRCGMGKVNSDGADGWQTTYHFPTGVSRIEHYTPPCEAGPLTPKYLAKYAKEIAAWKGHRHAIDMTPVLDKDAAAEATEAGITKSDEGADDSWKDQMLAAIKKLADERAIITSDDVWELVGRHGMTDSNPSALGSVFRRAAKEGYIKLTDQRVESQRPAHHRKPLRVWQSLRYLSA